MDEPTPLERAVDELVDRLLRGGGDDVAAFVADHPDIAPAEVARLEKLARVLGARGPKVAAATSLADLGPYRLIERLGAGGMGIVYLAEDRRLERRVALKVIRPELSGSAETLARFEREARAIAKLNHEHIVTVYETGREGDIAYLAMEYVKGRGLDELFAAARATQARVPFRDLLGYTRDAALALQSAHESGIVHRDVKPSNVRIAEDGRALLLDFGLALDVSSATLSRPGQVHGTLYYASPEQIAGGRGKVDPRTDVWSLGVTLYEGLTGHRPFEGERTEEVLHRIVTIEPVAPRVLAPGLRRDVETVVLKALEKDRERRYPTAAAFAEDLDALLAGRPIAARPSSAATKAWKWSRRKPAHAMSIGLAALLLVGGPTTFAVLQTRHAEALSEERAVAVQRADDLEALAVFQGRAIGGIEPAVLAGHIVEELVHEARAAWADAGAEPDEVERQAATLLALLEPVNVTDVAVTALRIDLLEPALHAARAEYADRPRVRGQLLHTLATTAFGFGLVDLALATQEEAVAALTEGTEGTDSDDDARLEAQANLGQFLSQVGRHDDAEPHLRAAAAGLARAHGPEAAATLSARQNLALLMRVRGELDETEAILRDVLAIRRRVMGDADPETALAVANLGALLLLRGRAEEAEPLLREAYQRRRDTPDTPFASVLNSANNLGVLLRNLGRLDEAVEIFQESFDQARGALGDEHPTTTYVATNLSQVMAAAGRSAEAEPRLREALIVSRRVSGALHADTLYRESLMGSLLLELGRMDEALDWVAGPHAAARAEYGVDAAAVQRLAAIRVRGLTATQQWDEAAAALLEARPAGSLAPSLREAADALFVAAPPALVVEARRAYAAEP